jgi:pyruvate/2-oxoacid:ferredoxin oxidoreductase alpha subunit
MEDADIAIFASGSAASTTRRVIDIKRAEGIKAGLVKLRSFRPFPCQRLVQALKGKKAIGVIDRSVAFGWEAGPMAVELKGLSQEIGNMPILSFIDGLANLDITVPHIERVVDEVYLAARGKPYKTVTWLPLEK